MTHDERLRAAAEELCHHQAVGMNDTAECAQWAHRELGRLEREREAKIERTVAVLRRHFTEPNGGPNERP